MQQQPWRPKRGDLVVRRPRETELRPVEVSSTPPRVRRGTLSNPLVPLVGFVLLIVAGTLLLWSPPASVAPGSADIRDALFTAVSAVTVTGLTVVDTGAHWSRFGQLVIMALIFVGGLGIMTSATLFYLLFLRSHPISLTESVQISRSLGRFQPGGAVRLARNIAVMAVAIQAAGFLILFVWLALGHSSTSSGSFSLAWQALFHAISAFNNAGFTIGTPGQPFVTLADKPTLAIVSMLIVLGGISYFVLADVTRHRNRFSRLSLNTKMVLLVSIVLWALGAAVVFLGEYANAATLGSLGPADKLVASIFHSISGRTAGFSTLDFARVEQQTLLWFGFLMFIGGAPGSAAGGVKVTSIGILVAAVLAAITNRERVVAFRRELPQRTINLALTVVFLSVLVVALVALLQTLWGRPGNTEADVIRLPFLRLLFETVSAFGTTGLTTGGPAEMSRWGQLLLMITMFVGRLGPLTVALMLVRREVRELYHYPQEEITIG